MEGTQSQANLSITRISCEWSARLWTSTAAYSSPSLKLRAKHMLTKFWDWWNYIPGQGHCGKVQHEKGNQQSCLPCHRRNVVASVHEEGLYPDLTTSLSLFLFARLHDIWKGLICIPENWRNWPILHSSWRAGESSIHLLDRLQVIVKLKLLDASRTCTVYRAFHPIYKDRWIQLTCLDEPHTCHEVGSERYRLFISFSIEQTTRTWWRRTDSLSNQDILRRELHFTHRISNDSHIKHFLSL